MKEEKRIRWLYKRRKRRGGKRSAKASVKSGMSSRLGVIRMGVRGPLCRTPEKGVEGLTTVGYPRLVKSSSKRRRSETFKLGKTPEDLDIHPRLIANFSSMPRKLRSEKREKIDEDPEICLVE